MQRTQPHPEIVEFQRKMATPEAQQIYRQRSQVAETPHLWWKAQFRLRQFHVRGLVKAGMELLWAALTYNIASGPAHSVITALSLGILIISHILHLCGEYPGRSKVEPP